MSKRHVAGPLDRSELQSQGRSMVQPRVPNLARFGVILPCVVNVTCLHMVHDIAF